MAYEWLEVKCFLNISKRGELSMNCSNPNGSQIGIPGVTAGNFTSVYLKAGGPPVLQPFACIVTVTAVSPPVTQVSVASKRTKTYVYDWTSPTLLNVCKWNNHMAIWY